MSPGWKRRCGPILDFDSGPNAARLVNNYDWMSRFSFLEFLRDVGKHFPVNVMLAKDSVKSRLERTDIGLSYTEFSYMLLQAYDFVHLNEHFGCQLQAGGSDQWGNITAGIDLARRLRSVESTAAQSSPSQPSSAQLYGLIWPLLTKSDGSKMGKTESGAIWLSAARTSPYQFYQYWVNVDDADAGRCLRTLTELSREEIESLDAARAAKPEARESQRRLAEELTRLIHGEPGLAAARRATEIFFGAEIDQLSDGQLTEIFADVPSVTMPRSRIEGAGLEHCRRIGRSRPRQKQRRRPPNRRARRRLHQQPPRRRHRPHDYGPRSGKRNRHRPPLREEEIRAAAIEQRVISRRALVAWHGLSLRKLARPRPSSIARCNRPQGKADRIPNP